MGGWFVREVNSPESYKGLRYRMGGSGAEVLRRTGAIVVTLPCGEIMSGCKIKVVLRTHAPHKNRETWGSICGSAQQTRTKMEMIIKLSIKVTRIPFTWKRDFSTAGT
jgi:hypothetical protein